MNYLDRNIRLEAVETDKTPWRNRPCFCAIDRVLTLLRDSSKREDLAVWVIVRTEVPDHNSISNKHKNQH